MAMLCMQSVMLLLSTAVPAQCLWTTTIYVSTNGSDTPTCRSNSGVENACLTLEYAVDGMTNSTQIVLLAGNHTLNTTIVVAGKQDIAFNGTEDSFLTCVSVRGTHGPGLHFENILRLYVTKRGLCSFGI